jgi:perosamine synthetase
LTVGRIPVAGPSITSKEVDYVAEAARDGWYQNAGVFHQRFEAAFARFVGRRYAMALPSCTSALHLALAAHGVGSGDEVVVSDLTWIASAAPITYVGAEPIFADVDPETWCMSADAFAACISDRTKAVIVVDLYGNMPDMDALLRVADAHGVAVIEDAAQAIGSAYRGRPAGAFGRDVQFSRIEDAHHGRGWHAGD